MGLRVDNPLVSGKMTFEQGMKVYGVDIEEAANKYSIPKEILSKLIYTESAFNKNAKSNKGATGLAQFMPATAKQYGVDVTDPKSSITGAAKMLSNLNKQLGGDWSKTLAAYNWGIGNLQKKGYENAPKETREYILKILGEQNTTESKPITLQTPLESQPIGLQSIPTNINYEMITEFQRLIAETKEVKKQEKDNIALIEAKNRLTEKNNAINFIKELRLEFTPSKK